MSITSLLESLPALTQNMLCATEMSMQLPKFSAEEIAEATAQLPPLPSAGSPPAEQAPATGQGSPASPHAATCGDITAAVASLSELARFDDTTGFTLQAGSITVTSPGAAELPVADITVGDITAGVALLSDLAAFGDTGDAGAEVHPAADQGVAMESAALGPAFPEASPQDTETPQPAACGDGGAARDCTAFPQSQSVREQDGSPSHLQYAADMTGEMSLCGDDVTGAMTGGWPDVCGEEPSPLQRAQSAWPNSAELRC